MQRMARKQFWYWALSATIGAADRCTGAAGGRLASSGDQRARSAGTQAIELREVMRRR